MLEMLPTTQHDDGVCTAGDTMGDLGAYLPNAFLIVVLTGFLAATVGFLALPTDVLNVLVVVMLLMEAVKCVLMG